MTAILNPPALWKPKASGLTFLGSLGSAWSAGPDDFSQAVDASGPAAANDLIIVCFSWKGGNADPSCADDRSNTYNLVGKATTSSRMAAILYSQITTALQTNDTVTVTHEEDNKDSHMQVYHLTGVFGGTVKFGTSAGSGSTDRTVTVTDASGFMCGCAVANNSGHSWSPGTGWTEDFDGNGDGTVCSAHRDEFATATADWPLTSSGTSAAAAIAASFV